MKTFFKHGEFAGIKQFSDSSCSGSFHCLDYISEVLVDWRGDMNENVNMVRHYHFAENNKLWVKFWCDFYLVFDNFSQWRKGYISISSVGISECPKRGAAFVLAESHHINRAVVVIMPDGASVLTVGDFFPVGWVLHEEKSFDFRVIDFCDFR